MKHEGFGSALVLLTHLLDAFGGGLDCDNVRVGRVLLAFKLAHSLRLGAKDAYTLPRRSWRWWLTRFYEERVRAR